MEEQRWSLSTRQLATLLNISFFFRKYFVPMCKALYVTMDNFFKFSCRFNED